MKSPAELRVLLKRQWEHRKLREPRLLGTENAWPIFVNIGRPSPRLIQNNLAAVKRHVETWRKVKIGEVVWESIRYRAADAPVDIPSSWKLRKPSEWVDACGDESIREEFKIMSTLFPQIDPIFRPLLVRQRYLWRGKPNAEIVQAARLAMALEPGFAEGRPLRTLSVEGIDTKFFERHGRLVTSLLDSRFDGEASELGLEVFLGALAEGDHWLLVMDLDGSLLHFRKQRVRSSELREVALPGEHMLIVENESCQHELPNVPGTIAVLGAGFDLGWASRLQLANKRIAYWGDVDSWGLQFLAKARELIGRLDALMMNAEVYQRFADSAVPEPVVASANVPSGLNQSERVFYEFLINEPRGRLEQEFLPVEFIRETILNWANRQQD